MLGRDNNKKLSYIEKCRKLAQYITGDTEELDEITRKLYDEIDKRIQDLPEKFVNFIMSSPHESSGGLHDLHGVFFVAGCLEQYSQERINGYITFSQNLYELFGNERDAITYLQRHVQGGSRLPVHDVCLFDIPDKKTNWNKPYWRKMIMRYGMQAARLLNQAAEIEIIRAQMLMGKNQNALIGLDELKRLHFYASKISYKNAHENPELAMLCSQHKKSEEVFEKSLAIVKGGLKNHDYLPDISFDGSDVGEKYKGLRFEKMALGDLRGFFLGDFTGCCQNIGSAGERCAIEGMTSEFAGFYVIYNSDNQIAVQMYAYLGKNNMLVLDSWEPKSAEYNYLLEPFLEKLSEEGIKQGYAGVRLGRGGRTPKNLSYKQSDSPTPPTKLSQGYDARTQYEVSTAKLKKSVTRDEIFKIIVNDKVCDRLLQDDNRNHFDIFNKTRADALISLFDTTSKEDILTLIDLLYGYEIGSSNDRVRMFNPEFINYLISINADGHYNDLLNHLLDNLVSMGLIDKVEAQEAIESAKSELMRPDANPWEALTELVANTRFFHPDSKFKHETASVLSDILLVHRPMFTDSTISPSDEKSSLLSDPQALLCGLYSYMFYRIYDFEFENSDGPRKDLEVFKSLATKAFIQIVECVDSVGLILMEALKNEDLELIQRIYAALSDTGFPQHYLETLSSSTYRQPHPGLRDANLLLYALYYSSNQAIDALLSTFYHDKNWLKDIDYAITQTGYNVVAATAVNNDPDRVHKLKEVIGDEQEWIQYINKDADGWWLKKFSGNALHFSASAVSLNGMLALMQTVPDIDDLHAFLMEVDSHGHRPLDYLHKGLVQREPEVINSIAAHISKAYNDRPDLLKQLIGGSTQEQFISLVERPALKQLASKRGLFGNIAVDHSVQNGNDCTCFNRLRQ